MVRAFEENDLEDYWRLIEANRPRLEKDFPITVKNTLNKSATQNWILQKIFAWQQKESFSFLILEKTSARLVGQLTIKTIDWRIPKAELAYFIDADWTGQGLMTEVVRQGVKVCFEHLSLSKVYIRAAPDNIGSQKIAEKCGFKMEGLLKKDHRQSDGTLTDVIYYGLLAE